MRALLTAPAQWTSFTHRLCILRSAVARCTRERGVHRRAQTHTVPSLSLLTPAPSPRFSPHASSSASSTDSCRTSSLRLKLLRIAQPRTSTLALRDPLVGHQARRLSDADAVVEPVPHGEAALFPSTPHVDIPASFDGPTSAAEAQRPHSPLTPLIEADAATAAEDPIRLYTSASSPLASSPAATSLIHAYRASWTQEHKRTSSNLAPTAVATGVPTTHTQEGRELTLRLPRALRCMFVGAGAEGGLASGAWTEWE
ncbi:hypothetical protein B0H13DRAFT_2313277 [Mycena leptocephala]|nr:hypothetical protein B0H13DRAFT_2313277 [Mycena leptocephala]